MAQTLPRLRYNLDFLPSSDPERPGLYIRDPYGYSDATLLIPPPLVAVLECFDGVQTAVELRAELVRITGEIQVGEIEEHLFTTLDEAAFLENETYRERKQQREHEFAEEPVREAAFAGSGYPAAPTELGELLGRKVGEAQGSKNVIGVAAPHASPDGGWATYRAAFASLPPREEMMDRTVVILGTSHYGAPNRFGLTRKPFVTPFGQTQTAVPLIDELERSAPSAVRMEDYCHAVEHSIEFQVVFLQHLYGPDIRILPILCGPFVKSVYEGGLPEDDDHVARFFDALGNLTAREGNQLLSVLGVDMAHMGLRYGDSLRAAADTGEMLAVKDRDLRRIHSIEAGDIQGYWSQIQEAQDDLKWCGSAPFYTFLKTQPAVRGSLRNYQQWQIDPASVVSFGAIEFIRS